MTKKKTRILGFRTLSTAVAWPLVSLGLALQDGMAGSVDTNFNPGTIFTPDIRCIIIDSNVNAVIGGPFREIGEAERTGLARLLTDGTLDTTFNPVVGGKILIGGQFTTVNGVGRRCIARINEDGSLDNGFDPGQGPDRAVQCMAVQSDGRALIGGSFVSSYGGREGLVRLNADGTLDETFSPLLKVVGEFSDGYITAIRIQNDGKIVIGGYFKVAALLPADWRNVPWQNVARFAEEGSLDSTFKPSSRLLSDVRAVELLNDGKIIIGGSFPKADGFPRNGIARLNGDGTLDESFDAGLGPDDRVWALSAQNDNKILVGGFFSKFNGYLAKACVRLEQDGLVDTTFSTGIVGDGFVAAFAHLPDRRILVGGYFTNYDGIARTGLARLFPTNDLTLSPRFAQVSLPASGQIRLELLSPSGRAVTILTSSNFASWATILTVTNSSAFLQIIDTQAEGVRFYRAELR
ncbi:MAG: hypothetical protein DME19_15885 [Verrucomicrobia bacterium]|nr:MAG: hypothetical protein DME19_15885 [Verrucomicrobiota bacterium]